jgi:hypothetical protein
MLARGSAATGVPTRDPRQAWRSGHALSSRARRAVKRTVVSSLSLACRPLERVLGGVRPDDAGVLTGTELTRDMLDALFARRACALRVPGFCPPELAHRLSEWLLRAEGRGNWGVENATGELAPSDTFYAGTVPFNVALTAEESFVRYFADALPAMRRLRNVTPELAPMDKLRLELEEVWPCGARLASYHGMKMATGVARIMTPDGMLDGIARTEGMCHVDGFAFTSGGAGVFSANVYLRVPDAGGELTIWNIGATPFAVACNLSLFQRLRDFDADAQASIRAQLPPPLTIRPAAGELVIIDSTRPHAVRGFDRGVRVTLQSFIKYKAGAPLALSV